MSKTVQSALADQFLAAIDSLGLAMDACPDALWDDRAHEPPFWYLAYHTLFWLDGYLSGDVERYRPPEPFGLEEMDPAGVMPPRTYTREELRAFLATGRARCAAVVAALDDANSSRTEGFAQKPFTRAEMLLQNMRHVQHHVGQLQMRLRMAGVEPPRWVAHGGPGPR